MGVFTWPQGWSTDVHRQGCPHAVIPIFFEEHAKSINNIHQQKHGRDNSSGLFMIYGVFLCLVFSCLSCLSCLLRASPSMTAPQMPFLPSAIGSPGPSAANGVENAGGLPRKPGDMEALRDGMENEAFIGIYRCGFPLTSNISIIEVFSIIFHCQVWFMEGIRFYGKETSKTPVLCSWPRAIVPCLSSGLAACFSHNPLVDHQLPIALW